MTSATGAARDPAGATAFVRAHTRLATPPLVPEVRLHLAEDVFALWTLAREALDEPDPPAPFWAFAWPGGQALARYVLDNPGLVAGRRVLDVGSGSGLVAIAAVRAGAAAVTPSDVDRIAVQAITLNAAANAVSLRPTLAGVLDGDGGDAEVILAADVFYERTLAERMMPFLAQAEARGVEVLVGDPGRPYLPLEEFRTLAEYDVPVPAGLEDAPLKRAGVLRRLAG